MKLTLVLLLFTGFVFGSAIPVTGLGQFWLDNFKDGNALVSFSGSNGVDSVSFGGDIPLGVTSPTSLFGSSLHSPSPAYFATIDGVTSDLWSLFLGDDGQGTLAIFDATGNVLISQDIFGLIQTTSYKEYGTRLLPNGILNDGWDAQGTFSIGAANNISVNSAESPLPESSSGKLVCAGFTLAALLRKYKTGSKGFRPAPRL